MKKTQATLPRMICCAVLLLFCLSVLTFPSKTLACACCSEPGTWSEYTGELSEWQMGEIGSLRFSRLARLYTGGNEPQGIDASDFDAAYRLRSHYDERRWRLTFTDHQRRAGSLIFSLPARMTSFAADLHDRKTSAGGGPLLYKEWRFEGRVTGTGMFRKGVTGRTRYRLVLQGRGNACTPAEDFRNWTLIVTGGGAAFSFYGSFQKPNP